MLSGKELVDAITAKLPRVTDRCAFCGQHARRDICGVHWLGIHDELGTEVQTPAPGHIPCAVIACSTCGNVSMLNLLTLGIVQIQPKLNLKLIPGGMDTEK